MAKKIFISPSNQDGNKYAYGNTTEDVQCGKIGKALETALKRCGFETKLEQYYKINKRVADANAWGADLYVPIHSNAFNGSVSGTRMFYGAAEGKKACECIFKYLAPLTPGTSENIKRATYDEITMPKAISAYIEVDFHDVSSVAKWIIEHPSEIAETICHGICDYFNVKYIAPAGPVETPKDRTTVYRVQVGAFSVKANADAMLKHLKDNGFDGFIVEAK